MPINDSTVARMAGNIAAGLLSGSLSARDDEMVARQAVRIARAIVAVIEEPPLSAKQAEELRESWHQKEQS